MYCYKHGIVEAMKLPIAPMSLPSNLKGVENGKLPNELLVPAHIPGKNWSLHPTAARACRAIVAAMGAEGIQVRATGTYRSYSSQVSLFISRYEPVSYARYATTRSSRRKVWKEAVQSGYSSIYWVMKQIDGKWPAMAAAPGTSNHGWALAVDFAEELDGDPQVESISSRAVAWLVKNAHIYGWSAEAQSEPWHWRYIAGDNVPSAVVTFEIGLQSTPPPPPTAPPVDLAAIAQAIASAKTYTLRLGSGGPGKPAGEVDAVKWLQVGLTNAVYYKDAVDGSFGKKTDEAVRRFQADRKLLIDGVVGPKTWAHIFP
jgi:LAS superfamily LD-carboxypeptidase LdcB